MCKNYLNFIVLRDLKYLTNKTTKNRKLNKLFLKLLHNRMQNYVTM